jgi:hypothetical protein
LNLGTTHVNAPIMPAIPTAADVAAMPVTVANGAEYPLCPVQPILGHEIIDGEIHYITVWAPTKQKNLPRPVVQQYWANQNHVQGRPNEFVQTSQLREQDNVVDA